MNLLESCMQARSLRMPGTPPRVLLCTLAALAGCAADSSSAQDPHRISPATPMAGGAANAKPVQLSPPGAGAAAASAIPQVAVAGTGAPPPTTPAPPGANASACDTTSLDQSGCACPQIGAIRACYSGAAATRSVGVCHDGSQTCVGLDGNEFGTQWSPCTNQVVPAACSWDVDARCVGKVGCADSQCSAELNCPQDAGMPDSSVPAPDAAACNLVEGFSSSGRKSGTLPDGSVWCEGQFLTDLFGDGGLFGPFIGGAAAGSGP